MPQLPHSYSEIYPKRFLEADLLKGKPATLTIKNAIFEELTGDDNKSSRKFILQFKERDRELPVNKTNLACLRAMFGADPNEIIGKRLTLYPTKTQLGRETVDCIRVYGSPDIQADITFTLRNGRKKPTNVTLHRTVGKSETAPVAEPEPDAAEASFTPDIRLGDESGLSDDEIPY